MNSYTYNGKTYRAWSVMACTNKEPHPPHVHNSEYFCYGPYLCWGTYGGPKHRKA